MDLPTFFLQLVNSKMTILDLKKSQSIDCDDFFQFFYWEEDQDMLHKNVEKYNTDFPKSQNAVLVKYARYFIEDFSPKSDVLDSETVYFAITHYASISEKEILKNIVENYISTYINTELCSEALNQLAAFYTLQILNEKKKNEIDISKIKDWETKRRDCMLKLNDNSIFLSPDNLKTVLEECQPMLNAMHKANKENYEGF